MMPESPWGRCLVWSKGTSVAAEGPCSRCICPGYFPVGKGQSSPVNRHSKILAPAHEQSTGQTDYVQLQVVPLQREV